MVGGVADDVHVTTPDTRLITVQGPPLIRETFYSAGISIKAIANYIFRRFSGGPPFCEDIM